jgi:hypothetical protein
MATASPWAGEFGEGSLRPTGAPRCARTVYLRGIFHLVEDSTPVPAREHVRSAYAGSPTI